MFNIFKHSRLALTPFSESLVAPRLVVSKVEVGMDDQYSIWIGLPRYSVEYVNGIKSFLQMLFRFTAKGMR